MSPIYDSEKRRKREDLMCVAATYHVRPCNISCAPALYAFWESFECPNDRFLAFEGTEIHVTDK
jgi:hypothetical protein